MKTLNRLLALAALSTAAVTAHAGTFADINLDGPSGDGWDGIAASATNTGTGPVNQIFIANNDSMLFIRITFNTPINIVSGSGFSLGIDSDNNLTTGFNTYGLGLIGSDVVYLGETPYKQVANSYTVATTTNAPLLVTDYGSAVSSVELGISRSALIDTSNNTLVFGGSTFLLSTYFDGGSAAGSGSGSLLVASYSFASASAVPEPSTYAAFAGAGVLGLAILRRRNRRQA